MDRKDIFKEHPGSNAGMTVPDGFFESFNKKMVASLPEQPWENPEPLILPRSRWQKMRPYIYMAAMFMGIWLMMKMFDMMRPAVEQPRTIENSSALMTALNNDAFYYDIMTTEIDDNDLYDDLYDQGFNPSDIIYSNN